MDDLRLHDFSDLSLAEAVAVIESEIRNEYLQDHSYPWVIGYSGGKDSTLVAHLVFKVLLELPKSKRMRPVHIVSNDTLVESPLVIQHVKTSLDQIMSAATALRLPIHTDITKPDVTQTFWVNLIGRGYPSPNRTFRWCTDRMKIQPTSTYIKSKIAEAENVILLLGVRRSESATRAASVKRYDNGERLNRHNDLAGCLVFRPIVELTTEDVWEYLAEHDAPWGGDHRKLIKLYRDAGGGECPVVTQKSDAPSCGSSSSRFGCWTCTVVDKDRSLEGFVESGFSEFGALIDFRDWLVTIRNNPDKRQARRRNGSITITSTGTYVPGPFTLGTRHEILDKLVSMQDELEVELIAPEEIEEIRKIWAAELMNESREATVHTIKKGK
ncbi:MAG: DNA phosphorothioation system sulfurtransferase DndC [Rhodobacter sp.]|nr:DNA phosphorothioation system sulfurtransferase DndC [Rhodobacter sp.]MCA3774278.1 DNA phosphorothioation system sulfurtransferase DndC [Cutibacterium sp.]MCA3518876.1 DNA phosphorothioation system sulfurtransferase DndC [Rhodobacter sp.]MCA3527586.1 DNA phosphorothioation system sulfurtransferase DndC [Rhodobacter sp.]MCA3530481.1 DNA phosphorothioation system sulfurtransferase DndC [Rhodobacter sp.]